MKSHDIMEAR